MRYVGGKKLFIIWTNGRMGNEDREESGSFIKYVNFSRLNYIHKY